MSELTPKTPEKTKKKPDYLGRTVVASIVAVGLTAGGFVAGENAGASTAAGFMPSGEHVTAGENYKNTNLDSLSEIADALDPNHTFDTVGQLENGNPQLAAQGYNLTPGETVSIPVVLEKEIKSEKK
jgi:hypothetical protein